MLSAFRLSSRPALSRAFSTTRPRAADLSKLVLIGRLTKDPEVRLTRNQKEFVMYTVATRNAPPPPDANGERQPATSTFHNIMSFSEHSNKYLSTLKKGSQVYAEATFEIRDPEPGSDPSTPQGQRQIFLRHENIRVINYPKPPAEESQSEEVSSSFI